MFKPYTEQAGGVGIEMVPVPAGRFVMGSPDSEPGYHAYEGPQHTVSLSPFYMGRYQVTQAQWRAVAKVLPKVRIGLSPAPSFFKADRIRPGIPGDGWNQPVEQVSWEEAVEFCDRLSRAAGKNYRLPTEAEWEYACRAQTTGPYAGSLDSMGWYSANSGRGPHPVGTKLPNALGLYDMHGNVWEWCLDRWHDSYDGAPTDGTAWTDGATNFRVARGGAFGFPDESCRSARRIRYEQDTTNCSIGFRVVAAA